MDDMDVMLKLLLSPMQPGEKFDDNQTFVDRAKQSANTLATANRSEGNYPSMDPDVLMQLLNPGMTMGVMNPGTQGADRDVGMLPYLAQPDWQMPYSPNGQMYNYLHQGDQETKL